MNTLPAKPDNFRMATTLCLTILLAACCAVAAPPTMRFDAQGKFKIVQFTDTHWDSAQEKAAETLDVIDTVLDAEKPDLVVLTGDIVTPERDPLADWRRLTARISGRKIPWAAVLGNHDDEKHGTSRREIVKYVATLPGSLTQEGPESLGGTGNYVVTIAHNDSDAPACVLYFLDSRAYPRVEAIRQCKEIPRHNHYDWISLDQITWYRETSRALRAARDGTPMPALAFFHIPLH
ncbi:MAG TPA: hypothetical protein DD670_00140, partial [Planctomycetaceae bacterium]|nr:hypothetical protein [Planctomycetaceae bacterium]